MKQKQDFPDMRPAPVADDARQLFPVVGIGASAGGLEVLKEFFSAMPADSGMAFLVIQHLDPAHESMMSEILNKVTQMDVIPAEDGTPVQVNTVYTIPSNTYLSIQKGLLKLSAPIKQGGIRLPIDFLFQSLAQDQGERAIGIILSGTGSDGTLGLRAIRGAGGMVLVQNPDTAEFDGMPRSALGTGLVNFTLPVAEMPAALTGHARHASIKKGRDPANESMAEARDELRTILTQLARRANSDFRCYKKSTVKRRIERRMRLRQIPTLAEYAKFLNENPEETGLLAKEMLIGVTSFFRDPEIFEELRQKVLAPLIQEKEAEAAIRVWVPGCATGEEAYTIAMLLLEELEVAGKHCPVQVFASDIDEQALECARAGLYPESSAAEVPAPYLERHFFKQEHGWQVGKRLREAVVFAVQNVISDPPFSKLDLVSCRNLLIYLENDVQKKIIAMFSFALVPGGYLLLGKSEGVAGQTEHFELLSKQPRLYQRGATTPGPTVPLPPGQQRLAAVAAASPGSEKISPLSFAELNQQVLLKHFSACVLLVTSKGQILHFYGDAGKYLDFPSGEASLNIFSLARERLATRLRQALQKAVTTGEEVRLEQVPHKHAGGGAFVNLTVTPVRSRRRGDNCLSIIFEDAPQSAATQPGTALAVKAEEEPLIRQLEAELQASREDLQATTEELDAASEEHEAVMEELTSMNEELQSANEELETSKEEMQSLNEELTTVNGQLVEKLEELSSTSNDLANLFASTDIATIFLDTALRIKRFTPAATRLLNLLPADVGRPVAHISQNFTDDLSVDAGQVLRDLATIEKEVQTRDGRWYMLRALPYRTQDNRIDGVVFTFTDVSRMKEPETALREAKLYAESIVATVREPLLALDGEQRIRSANAAFYKTFQTTPEATEGLTVYELESRQWDLPALHRLLEEMLPDHSQIEDYEVNYELPDGGKRIMLLNARRMESTGGRPLMVLLAIEDVTGRRNSEAQLLQVVATLKGADRQKDEFLAMLAHELRNPMAPIRNANAVIGLIGKQEPLIVKQCELIGRQVGHMSRLLDDLLDVSRITRGRISLQKTQFDLREVLDHAIESTQELFSKLQQELLYVKPPEPLWINGDFTRLVQVFYNLLINANKYTKADGRIWLSAVLESAHGNPPAPVALVRIKDTGIGIAPEALPHIFELFSQADMDQTHAQGGLGIGLTLVQRLVQMHGGRVQARSEGQGQGSEFTVRLPALLTVEPTADKPEALLEIVPQGTQLRIMVVDDLTDAAASMAELIKLWGHEARTALDGAAALTLMREFHPDLVLLDIGMPGMNGYELARLLRQEFGREPMLVALTGYGQEEDRRQAAEAGFDRHLTKPVDLPVLCELLSLCASEKIHRAGLAT